MIAELLLSWALGQVPNICDIEGPPDEESKACTQVNDPVNLATGFSFHDVTDFALETGKGPFVLKRYYMPVGALGGSKSPLTTIIGEAWPKNAPPGPFGTPAGEQRPVWSNDLYSFVEPCPVSDGGCSSPTGLALLFDGDFRWTTFNRDGGAGPQTAHRKNPATPLRLEALPSAAGYRVIRDNGDQWFYLKLTASTANTGPVLLSEVYDRNGLLKYTLTYPGSGCVNRSSGLTFASGRALTFNYTGGCVLQSITSGGATLANYSYWNSDAGLLSAGGDPTSQQGYRYPLVDGGGFTSGEFQVMRAAAPDAGLRASHNSLITGLPITSYSGGGSDFDFTASFTYTSYDEGFATPYLGCNVITDDVAEDNTLRIGVPVQFEFKRSAIRNAGELSAAPGVSTSGTITVGSYNDDLFGRGTGAFAWRTDSCSTAGTCPVADDAGVATVISRVAPLTLNTNNVCSDGRDGGSAAVPFATQNRRGWWSAERRVLSAHGEQMSTITAQGMDKAPVPTGSTVDTTTANALQVQTLNAAPVVSDGIRLNTQVEMASALPTGGALTTVFNQRFVDAGTVTVGGKVLHGSFLELEWQRGNTKVAGSVTTKYRGTFFRRQRACGGGSTPDPLNRVLRIEGPCEIANENATACTVIDNSAGPVTEFTYFEADAGANDVGRLAKISQYPNANVFACWLELATTFANYTPEGFPQSVTDPNGVTRTFTFSGTKMTSSSVPTADGGVSTTSYAYDADGQLRSIQYPEGNFEVFCRHTDSTTSCDFSKPLTGRLEWRARSTSSDGFLAPERINYAYWADGRLQTESFGSSNPWLVKQHFADSLGRSTFEGLGSDANNPGVYETRRLDGNGNVLGVGTKFVNGGAGAPNFCGAGTPSPLCPEMVFDRADRLSRTDLHPTTSTTERSCIDYDGQGNPRRIIQGCSSSDTCSNNQSVGATTQCTNSGSPPTDYDIDDFGQVVAVRAPWSGAGTVSETRYEYNALGRVVRKETQVMRNAGTYEQMVYDQLGRLQERRSVNSSGWLTQLFALSWDTAQIDPGCPSQANARTMGRLAYRDDTFGRTSYQYDPEGRVLAEFGQRVGAPSPLCDVGYTNSAYYPTTTYSYSKNGNLQTLRYPHGRTIIYAYGTGALTDRITTVSYTIFNGSTWSSPQTLLSSIQWLPYGPLSSYTFDGNGNTHTVTNAFGKYSSTPSNACNENVPSSAPDGTGRQSGVFVTRALGAAMLKKAYTWLGEELLTEQTCYPSLLQTTEERKTFEYDNTHRLTKESRVGHPQMTHGLGGAAINPTRATSYGYTSRGNRNAMTIDGCSRYFTIPGGINRDLLSVTAPNGTAGCQGRFSGPTLSWDADGRVTQNATAWYFNYTDFGYGNAGYGSLDSVYHTASIRNFTGLYNGAGNWATSTYQYYYDAFNRRRLKVFPTGTTQEFFYDSGHGLLSDVTPISISNGSSFTIEDTVWLDGAPVAAIRGSLFYNGSAFVRGNESATTTCASLSDGAYCNAYMLISDRLKRPVMMIRKSTAEITQAANYDAFGQVNRIPVMAGMNDNNPNQSIAKATLPGDGGVGVVNLVRVRANYVVPPTNAILLAGQTVFPASYFPKANTVSPYINLGAAGSATMTTANTGTPPAPSGGLPGMQSNEFEYYRTSAGLGVFTNLRMPGQYYDAELDVFENWNRFYEPSLGRYLSPEPLLNSPSFVQLAALSGESTAPYGYALNNPVGQTDPTGLCPPGSSCAMQIYILPSGEAITMTEAMQLGLVPAAAAGAAATAKMAGPKVEGLIDHLDQHIQKLNAADENCAQGLPPDPEDPNKDPRNGWRKEIKAAMETLIRRVKKVNNKLKAEPIMKAIKRAQERGAKPSPDAPKKP